jgi:hypothetical protein
MKKLVLGFILILFAVSGLFSQSDESSSFKVKTTTSEDIEGTITTSEMIISSTLESLMPFSIIKFNLCKQSNSKNALIAYIEIVYTGDNWRFIDTLQLKIDNKLYTISPTVNNRYVIKGTIFEVCTATLTKEMVTELQTCKSITLQANGEKRGAPYNVDSAGMVKINKYMLEK